MSLFKKDYEKAGVGIDKRKPKKSGIKLFFEILGVRFWQIMQLNFIYSCFFIPAFLAVYFFMTMNNKTIATIVAVMLAVLFMVMIGPATAGLFKVLRNYSLDKHSFLWSDFKKGYRDNFKNACIIGVIDVLVAISIFAGLYIYPQMAKQSGFGFLYVFLAISLSLGLVVSMMNFYIFLMMVATNLSLKNIIKNSFALSFVAIKTNIVVLLVTGLLLSILPVLILVSGNLSFLFIMTIFPAAYNIFIICFYCYPVVQKYVINPYYESINEVNPELKTDEDDKTAVFEDKGGSEKPIESRKKRKGKTIS